jgi:CBS domain-containing protein
MLCKEIMTRGVESICRDANVKEAAQMMQQLDVGILPVVHHDHLVGVMTDRDIVLRTVAIGKKPEDAKVGEVMTPNLIVCYEEQSLEEAARLMENQQIRRLLVVNRHKNLVGILSLGDLAGSTSADFLTRKTLQKISEDRME